MKQKPKVGRSTHCSQPGVKSQLFPSQLCDLEQVAFFWKEKKKKSKKIFLMELSEKQIYRFVAMGLASGPAVMVCFYASWSRLQGPVSQTLT